LANQKPTLIISPGIDKSQENEIGLPTQVRQWGVGKSTIQQAKRDPAQQFIIDVTRRTILFQQQGPFFPGMGRVEKRNLTLTVSKYKKRHMQICRNKNQLNMSFREREMSMKKITESEKRKLVRKPTGSFSAKTRKERATVGNIGQSTPILPHLPDEIWNTIFGFLQQPREWMYCRTICHQWQRATDLVDFPQILGIQISTPTRECAPLEWSPVEMARSYPFCQLPVITRAPEISTSLEIICDLGRIYLLSVMLDKSLLALAFIWRRLTMCFALTLKSNDSQDPVTDQWHRVHEASPFHHFITLIQELNRIHPLPISNLRYHPYMPSSPAPAVRMITPWLHRLTTVEVYSGGENLEEWAELLSKIPFLYELAIHIGPPGPHVEHLERKNIDFASLANLLVWETNKSLRKLGLRFCNHADHDTSENYQGLAAVLCILPPVEQFELALPERIQYAQGETPVHAEFWNTERTNELMKVIGEQTPESPFRRELRTLIIGPSDREPLIFSEHYRLAFPQLTTLKGARFCDNLVIKIYAELVRNIASNEPANMQIHCLPMFHNAHAYRQGMSTLYGRQPDHETQTYDLPEDEEILLQIQDPGEEDPHTTIIITARRVTHSSYRVFVPLQYQSIQG
jgi:hypothetical protein